jgi:hypothetical protein
MGVHAAHTEACAERPLHPTQAEMQAIGNKIDELITAQRRQAVGRTIMSAGVLFRGQDCPRYIAGTAQGGRRAASGQSRKHPAGHKHSPLGGRHWKRCRRRSLCATTCLHAPLHDRSFPPRLS